MIVTDGFLWFNSKEVLAVGRRVEADLSVYLKGLHGCATLKLSSPERAYAIKMRLILGLADKKEIKEITDFLFKDAEIKKLDTELIKKEFEDIINQKGGEK